ncbi:MAG: hypothetical protein ACM3RP_06155 [Chitinophagales bacterium]
MKTEGNLENLVLNPSFEPAGGELPDTAPGWFRNPNLDFATYRVEKAPGRSGGYAQRISSRHLDLAYVYQRVPVTGGRTYRVSAWLKVSGDASGLVMAIPGDAEGHGVGAPRVDSPQVPGESDWQEVELIVPTTEACVTLTLICRIKTIGERGGSIWFDDVFVGEAAALPVPAAPAYGCTQASQDGRPVLVPRPKQVQWLSGACRLYPATPLVVEGGAFGALDSAVRELRSRTWGASPKT